MPAAAIILAGVVSADFSGDRALTWANPPKGGKTGAKKPETTTGHHCLDVKRCADDFGLTNGDTISINVLGREVTARIYNGMSIGKVSRSILFSFLNPGVPDDAPHS